MLLSHWLERWLDAYKKPAFKRPETYTAYKSNIRMYVLPVLGRKPLKRVNGLDVQKLLISIPYSRTREAVKHILAGAFKDAFALRLVSFNPMLAVRIPKHRRKVGSALSAPELDAFLSAIRGHALESYFRFCLYTGCRRSEALAVTVADVDFTRGLLHIPGTKTRTSDRVIPLFPIVAELVATLGVESGLLFPFCGNRCSKIFHTFCPEHHLHDLRHTFATRCLESGVSPKVLQVWLGHSEISTTLDIYSHVSPELSISEADKVKCAFPS
jgi:integrase